MSHTFQVEFQYYDEQYIYCVDRTNTLTEQHKYWYDKFEKAARASQTTGSYKYFSPLQLGSRKFRIKLPKNIEPLKKLANGAVYRLKCKILHGNFKVDDVNLFGWRITAPEFFETS